MPKIIEKYCFIEIPGATYILHTQEPFLIGRVWLYKSLPALTEQIEKLSAMAYVQMETHCIAITLWAVLGDRFVAHAGTKEEIKILMQGMMDFFLESRNVYKSKFYDKFRI